MTTSAAANSERFKDKSLICENTYRLDPTDKERFSSCKAQREIKDILDSTLQDMTYDPNTTSELACKIADQVKDTLKDNEANRHKIVCHVVLGSSPNAEVKVASRCLWNDKNDTSASVSYQNKQFYAIVTVFAGYHE